MKRRRWLAVVLVASLSGTAVVARAQGEIVRVDYEAPTGCPDASSFRAQVRARTDRAELVTVGDTPRTFSVHVASSNGRVTGRLEVREAGGATTVRELSGDRCDDVVAGLALTGALAIDPSALMPKPPPPIVPPAPAPRPVVTVARKAPRAAFSVGIGLDLLVASGVANGVALGGALSLDVSVETRTAFAPWVRLAAAHARTDIVPLDSNMDSAWTVGSLSLSPIRLPRGGIVGLRPLFITHIGALEAWGVGVQNARASTLAWADAGVGARLEVTVARHFGVGIEGSAAIPITRVSFVLDGPRMLVYEAPWVAITASAGAHVAF